MFACSLWDTQKYNYLEERFMIAYRFLQREDLAELPEGAVELENGIVAQIQHYTTSPQQELFYETHDRFFDVQYMVRGEELFGVLPRVGLVPNKEANEKIQPGNDIFYYQQPDIDGSIFLREGDMIVVSPEDAHKPRCMVKEPKAVIKVVVKVPV